MLPRLDFALCQLGVWSEGVLLFEFFVLQFLGLLLALVLLIALYQWQQVLWIRHLVQVLLVDADFARNFPLSFLAKLDGLFANLRIE